MKDTKKAFTRYVWRTLLFMASYALLNVSAIAGTVDHLSLPSLWVYSALVAFPIAAQIYATLSLVRDSDEFVGALMAKRMIVAMGLTIALFSAWGFAESYAHAPHAPGWLTYPLFWALFGVTSPFLQSTKR